MLKIYTDAKNYQPEILILNSYTQSLAYFIYCDTSQMRFIGQTVDRDIFLTLLTEIQ